MLPKRIFIILDCSNALLCKLDYSCREVKFTMFLFRNATPRHDGSGATLRETGLEKELHITFFPACAIC